MRLYRPLLPLLLSASLLPAWAATGPALVYTGGDFIAEQQNAQIHQQAVTLFTQMSGVSVKEITPVGAADRLTQLRQLASDGYSPIVVIGNTQLPTLQQVASEFPQAKFTLIDGQLAQPNVQSVQFNKQEAAFLVGALAAMVSETGLLGFVGGMDLPAIHKSGCGFAQGARYANPSVQVSEQYVTSTLDLAFNDPKKGAFTAKQLIDEGVDVLFADAHGTGLGVYQAAADARVRAIGATFQQADLHPGTMLTAIYQNVPKAVLTSLTQAQAGQWQAGNRQLGLAEDYVGWVDDQSNAGQIRPAHYRILTQLQQDIVDGKLQVHDFSLTGSCLFPQVAGGLCQVSESGEAGHCQG
ncbi:MAG: BMP family ABC transporter substrate-binding protein [Aeromonadaceae bacterium]|nr:BMP family ABC transporter substrate-binding protein [Aeromonadaceae bacterium]